MTTLYNIEEPITCMDSKDQPAPIDSVQPAPIDSVQPAPIDSVQPAPIDSVQPAPVVPVPRCMVTLDGDRPFTGAVEMYEKLLDDAVQRTVAELTAHPEWKHRQVKFNLFGTLDVPCLNMADGKECVKKFSVNDIHYGPRSRITPFIGEDRKTYEVRSFCTRDLNIWNRLRQSAPVTGDEKTAVRGCSPFRKYQMKLADEKKLFLFDYSYHYMDPNGTVRYFQNMVIFRQLQQPVVFWHEYGLIPCAWKYR